LQQVRAHRSGGQREGEHSGSKSGQSHHLKQRNSSGNGGYGAVNAM
jgi:hypothetical protein